MTVAEYLKENQPDVYKILICMCERREVEIEAAEIPDCLRGIEKIMTEKRGVEY